MASSPSRWPDGYHAAVSVTLDNMGEAAELYRGTWPEEKPVGVHFSVTESLPRILNLLKDTGVRATYFIEGWNAEVYSAAIQTVRHAGHEVAFHGWQHEPWSQLARDEEQRLIEESCQAFERLDLEIRGFRPPGGVLTGDSVELLRSAGITYCSPAGTDAAMSGGMVYLPFEWGSIDAYYYSDGFARLREVKGDSEAPISPAELVRRFNQIIDQRIETGGYVAILFHPFLEIDQERIDAMRRVLERVAADERIWCAPCTDVAEWIQADPDAFSDKPSLDTTTWSR